MAAPRYIHDMITVRHAVNVELEGQTETENSWFPGETCARVLLLWHVHMAVACLDAASHRFATSDVLKQAPAASHATG